MTPLCTQLTYTGVLDDWFNTECGKVTFPGDVGIHEDQSKTFQHMLSSEDQIFSLIRDRHITTCAGVLTSKIKELKKTDETNLDNLRMGQKTWS